MEWNSTCFGQFLSPSSGVFHCTHNNGIMSYRFADTLQAGSGWNILILLASCPQTCMPYNIGECTVKNSWWWTEERSETCRVSFQNKFEELVHLVGFIVRNLSRCTVTWTSRTLSHSCTSSKNFFCGAATQHGSWPPHARGLSRRHTTTHHSQ